MNVAIVGATGQVGGVMRTLLGDRGFPLDGIRFLASARSAGTTLEWLDTEVIVEDTATADWSGIDVALVSAGKTASLEYAPVMVDAGAIVVDNSSAWRMDPEVPLMERVKFAGIMGMIYDEFAMKRLGELWRLFQKKSKTLYARKTRIRGDSKHL